MARFDPVDPRVRLAIAQCPPDAPRGAVSTFCLEHATSRKTFYATRRRALEEGQAAALEPRSRRPLSSPNRITEDIKKQAIGVRAALEQSGLDHGPISVHEKMRDLGMTPVPSTAALARIFRDANVARPSRGRSRGPPTDDSSIPPRTRAGSWARPTTSSPAAGHA